jgi:exopolysaccharide biosynthesis predicted pyruvyltransferase EpsI
MNTRRSRLLPLEAFAPVFEPLLGKRIGYVRPYGNVGDALIEWATGQLFDELGIDWRPCDPQSADPAEFDELVFGGGGNMGTRYRNNWELRGRALALGLPLTILPQSFTSPEERRYQRVYVRERASLAFCPEGILAPDLALGLAPPPCGPPTRGLGVFLRRDPERAAGLRWFSRDPARLCATPRQYLELAARYERIVTDRLHFAICGLLAGRQTTLLPNDYHKNASMFETWLQALGCRFAGDARAALARRQAA